MHFLRSFTLWLLAFWLFASGVVFASCVPEDYAQELTLPGLGVVYTGDFRYNSARDEARLFNGVCFTSAGEPSVTLSAPTMHVAGVQAEPTFVAEGATLTLETFTLFAERLSGNAVGIRLRNLSVMSPQFSGRAVRARYNLERGWTVLTGVSLRLGNFRVESTAAALSANRLVLRNARASTCACEGDGPYTLSAPGVTINLLTGVARIKQGRLEAMGLRVPLNPNLRLLLDGAPGAGGSAVIGGPLLAAPAAPEPVGATIDQGTKVAVPLQLAPWASLELGGAGFAARYPTGLVALLNLNLDRWRAALGRVGPGWRADAIFRTPLAPGLDVDLSTTNRDWRAAGFLHEVALSLNGARRLTQISAELGDTLVLSGQLFGALSRQTLADTLVASPRLGVKGSALYTGAPTPLGTFGLRTETGFTYYPLGSADDQTQLGVKLVPSWRAQSGPLYSAFSFEHQAVLGGSPFAKSLDRLEPKSFVDGSVAWVDDHGSLKLQGRYAFRLAGATNPVRIARLEAARTFSLGDFSTVNRFTAEFAGLLGPADRDIDAFVRAETEFVLASDLELGFKARYDLLPDEAGLKLLEVYASYPLTFSGLTLRPFLGLNAAPLVTGEPLPTVTGYGLSVAVKSCCGTLVASYRLHDESVRTAFDVRLSP